MGLNCLCSKDPAPIDVVTLLVEEYFTLTSSLPQFIHKSIAQVFEFMTYSNSNIGLAVKHSNNYKVLQSVYNYRQIAMIVIAYYWPKKCMSHSIGLNITIM